MKERILFEEEPDEDPWSTASLIASLDLVRVDVECDSEGEEAEVELDKSLQVDNEPSLPPSPILPRQDVIPQAEPESRRWAKYPTTLFCSDRLPISQVRFPLPSIHHSSPSAGGERASATFGQDRKALWDSIVQGRQAQVKKDQKTPPWRSEGAFDFVPLPSRNRSIA